MILTQIEQNFENEKEKIHKRDLKFFQIDQLLRIAERLDNNATTCKTCQGMTYDMEKISSSVANLINGSPNDKREFERKTDAMKKHLKEVHQIYPVYYFVSLFAFIGIAIGGAAGAVVGLILPSYFVPSVVVGVVLGLGIGYFRGTKKDWAVRREKRLL